MKVLGLDTSTLISGIAVVEDGVVLAEARHDASGHKSDLLVAIDDVCRRAGVAPMQLDAVAVGAGPGSFTGLRIGMATAKGIAFATGKPLWVVSSLAALADDARFDGGTTNAVRPGDVIVAALDARKGEVYAGCYRVDEAVVRGAIDAAARGALADTPARGPNADAPALALVGEERVLAPGALAAWVRETGDARAAGLEARVLYAGDAIASYPEALASLAGSWTAARTPSGAAVARLALSGARVDLVTEAAPSYIRKAEAEVMYPDGVPGALPRRDP